MSNSYRQILRSSSIIGSALMLNILISLVRTKVIAILLGPSGVGLVGLLQSLVVTVSTVSALGIGTVATRQIVEALESDDELALAMARRALFWGTLLLATSGCLIFWIFREVVAVQVLDNAMQAGAVGWLVVGVLLTVASGSQGALLRGFRRIGDIGRLSVYSALWSTALGIVALLLWGDSGLLVFVLVAPLASFLVGLLYVAKLPKIKVSTISLLMMVRQWKIMARLGIAFMVAGLVSTLGGLVVRMLVQRELGPEALGHFQASWSIAMIYIGFIIGAMGSDFYPRLIAVIDDGVAVNRLVNEQSEVALLLAGPVFLAMLGIAPWIIELLYSSAFSEASTVLRWQILGDVLKIMSWPLGLIILAAGDGRAMILMESLATATFIGITWISLPILGIEAAGIGFFVMYVFYLISVYRLAQLRTCFQWQHTVLMQLFVIATLAFAVFFSALYSQWLGLVIGLLSAIGFGFYSLERLGRLAGFGGAFSRIFAIFHRLMKR